MKKLLFILILCLVGGVSTNAATVLVRMTRFNTFDPKDITINLGDTVRWTNTVATFHDAVAFDETFRSPLFGRGGTYSFTFSRAGRFDYYCTPHLDIGMVGSVTVVGGPENQPPTASIASPAGGSSFEEGQAIEVTVNAADDGGVAKVELLVDGNIAQTDTSAPYQFTLSLTAGPHTLVARATDQPGLTGNSAPVAITVRGPNAPPTVRITAPTDGSAFTAPASLILEAEAADDESVARVEFLADGVVIGSDDAAPFTLPFVFDAAGERHLVARAFDNAGLSATSAHVTIQIKEPLPEVPTIAIIAPGQGDYIGTNSLFVAEAADADGAVTKVQFLEGALFLGEAAPAGTNRFELNIPLAEGRRTISAYVIDDTDHTNSASVTVTVALRPAFTSSETLANGNVRLSVFGTSGVPFVFEYSEDMTTWTPFLTNALVRRILFFDDDTAAGATNRIYRARSPD